MIKTGCGGVGPCSSCDTVASWLHVWNSLGNIWVLKQNDFLKFDFQMSFLVMSSLFYLRYVKPFLSVLSSLIDWITATIILKQPVVPLMTPTGWGHCCSRLKEGPHHTSNGFPCAIYSSWFWGPRGSSEGNKLFLSLLWTCGMCFFFQAFSIFRHFLKLLFTSRNLGHKGFKNLTVGSLFGIWEVLC